MSNDMTKPNRYSVAVAPDRPLRTEPLAETMVDPNDVLLKASEWLKEPDRWIQGFSLLHKGGTELLELTKALADVDNTTACASGAIVFWSHMLADGYREAEDVAFSAQGKLAAAIDPPLKPNTYPAYPAREIVRWNDSPERTVDEVTAMMRKAAS